jgi:hypothetical protein
MQTVERRWVDARWDQIRQIQGMSPDASFQQGLNDWALSLPDRKTEFHLQTGDVIPWPLFQAREVVWDRFGKPINFDSFVVKKYVPGDPSQAFGWHIDPEEYLTDHYGSPKEMVIWTTQGRASFSVMTDGNNKERVIDCPADSAIKAPAHTRHKISRPNPDYGTRIIYWFGKH